MGEEEPLPRVCRFCLEEEEEDSQDTTADVDIESQRLINAAPLSPSKFKRGNDRWFDVIRSVVQKRKTAKVILSPTKNKKKKDPLIAPCYCCGTSRYVHVSCLEKWRMSTPAAFNKCTVCGYEYRFRRHPLASVLRTRPVAPLAHVLMLIVLCWLLGFMDAWHPSHGNFGLHMINGFVILGLAGFGITIADVFSPRRALQLLTCLAGGDDVSATVMCLMITLFQLGAIVTMVACLALAFGLTGPASWGVVVLAAVGLNPLSCGPVHRSIKEGCDRLVSKLDMTTSKMVLEEICPRPPAPSNLTPGQQQVLNTVLNGSTVTNTTGRPGSYPGGTTVSQGTQTGSLNPSPSVPVRTTYPGAALSDVVVLSSPKSRSCGGQSYGAGAGCDMQQAVGRECRIVIAPATFCIRLSQSIPGVGSGAVQRPLRMTQSVPVSVSSSSCWACHAHVQQDSAQATPTARKHADQNISSGTCGAAHSEIEIDQTYAPS